MEAQGQQEVRTVCWEEDERGPAVCLVDQSLLPQRVVCLRLTHEQDVADAIKSLKVRGAPAIGVTAAFGMALAARRLLSEERTSLTMSVLLARLRLVAQLLQSTRPTAVNLFWAIDRMLAHAEHVSHEEGSVADIVDSLVKEAQLIAAEDAEACARMGAYGAELIADGTTLLTHCNAGALATAGIGTALAPIYVAHRQGKQLHVFVDETRPVLQGARLTAWELQQQGVPLTLITDSMAGHFMRTGAIQAVFVGADRIAANGDVANKIGTYSVAVLAHEHGLPFYVVAPCSTIDLHIAAGDHIPIEQRAEVEVTTIRDVPLAPAGVQVANPAFDVTPNIYVTAIITEQGIARPPYITSLQHLCSSDGEAGKVL